MQFPAALLPGGGAGRVADTLDTGAPDGMLLTRDTGGDNIRRVCAESEGDERAIKEARHTVAGVGDTGGGRHGLKV